MAAPPPSPRRREKDLKKLIMSDYKVEMMDDKADQFFVFFHGPAYSVYHGGVWKVEVVLPADYPCNPPSIMFSNNKIFHPNVDDVTGVVCVDVLEEKWSSEFDLVKVFESVLPSLLLNPNPDDPMNREAAALMIADQDAYNKVVQEMCQKHAKPEDVGIVPEQKSSDEKMSGDDDHGSNPPNSP